MVAQWVGPTIAKKKNLIMYNPVVSSDKAKTYCM